MGICMININYLRDTSVDLGYDLLNNCITEDYYFLKINLYYSLLNVNNYLGKIMKEYGTYQYIAEQLREPASFLNSERYKYFFRIS